VSSILIKGGRVIDPGAGRDATADVLIERGKIVEVGEVTSTADEVIDARRRIVCPGLIDVHVHLREPGNDETETIATGVAAAVAGGFTAVVCMPNTHPPVDTPAAVEFVYRQSVRAALARVYPVGTVTKGRSGAELAELAALRGADVVGFSDDGDPVADAEVMRRALQYARMLDLPVITHAEDRTLSAGGVMHEGAVSARLGLPGISAESEAAAVARDVTLAEETGARLHVAHVSTAGAVEAVRRAKDRGVRVTAEACVHHLTLSDTCLLERDDDGILKFDTSYKMSPPLRSPDDVEALRKGLRDGTIDCIVSDHAPHPLEAKAVEFTEAAFGVIGLETSLAVVVTELIAPGVLTWLEAVALLSTNPARALGLPGGTLEAGSPADVTLIDPECEWTIDASAFHSLSRNTPFDGKEVKGKAACTIVGGEVKTAPVR